MTIWRTPQGVLKSLLNIFRDYFGIIMSLDVYHRQINTVPFLRYIFQSYRRYVSLFVKSKLDYFENNDCIFRLQKLYLYRIYFWYEITNLCTVILLLVVEQQPKIPQICFPILLIVTFLFHHIIIFLTQRYSSINLESVHLY